jgi:hypothetical protein
MTDEQMYTIYMASPSLRYAAKRIQIPKYKLRMIRDLEGWPKKCRLPMLKKTAAPVHAPPPPRKPRTPRMSLFDAIETEGGLSPSDLKRALEL